MKLIAFLLSSGMLCSSVYLCMIEVKEWYWFLGAGFLFFFLGWVADLFQIRQNRLQAQGIIGKDDKYETFIEAQADEQIDSR